MCCGRARKSATQLSSGVRLQRISVYELVNRSMIIVKPKKPFLDWANGVDDDHNDFTVKEMEDDCAVFLIKDFEEDREQEEILRKHHKIIFEAELGGWCTDESMWPTKRDFKTFKQWFRVEFHSMVFDLQEDDYIIEDAEV